MQELLPMCLPFRLDVSDKDNKFSSTLATTSPFCICLLVVLDIGHIGNGMVNIYTGHAIDGGILVAALS
jgi:hypothetical protein